MKRKDIKIKWASMYINEADMYLLREIDNITLQPQSPEPGMALTPEAHVVIENTENLVIMISLARHADRMIYSSCNVYTSTGFQGCYPSPKWGPGQRTVRETLRVRLKELQNHRDYNGPDIDREVGRIAKRAIRELNNLCQMSIFDML